MSELTKAETDVLAERRRQIEVEGWAVEHDDCHDKGEMALAASAYAIHSAKFRDADEFGINYRIKAVPCEWPWDREWWKPKNPRRDLVRAAALIIAEIERLDRIKGLS
jgi:hypothetical protein